MNQHQLAEAAFVHVIEDLIGQKMDGPIALSLLEYSDNNVDIRYVLNMFDEEIDDLTYTKSEEEEETSLKEEDTEITIKTASPKATTTTHVLTSGYKRFIKVVRSFHQYRAESNNPVLNDWSDVSPEEFNDFRISKYKIYTSAPMPSRFASTTSTSFNNTSPSDTSPTPKHSQAEQFRKGIKRSKDDFMVLKDRKQFKEWYLNLLATVAEQDVSDILNPNYIPTTLEEIEFFNNK